MLMSAGMFSFSLVRAHVCVCGFYFYFTFILFLNFAENCILPYYIYIFINILYILFYYYTTIITLDEACLNKIKEKETKQKYPSKSTASCPRTNI